MALRRRREDEEPGKEAAGSAPAEAADEAEVAKEGGPWDSTDSYPELQRLDFGSMLIPVAEGLGFQLNLEPTGFDDSGEPVGLHPTGVLVQHQESVLQIQVFAAPKRSGIWDDIRQEHTNEIVEQAGGQVQEAEGPFGDELLALIPAELTEEVLAEMPEEVRAQIPQEIIDQGYAFQPLRFIGVDGPRWFLQGVVQGAAIEDEEQWQVLEDVFRNIVVNRGEQPMAPRDVLELTVPAEFQEQAEAEAAAEDGEGFDPFERGPEITEVR